ncbi:hypothetical protein ABH922_002328 [Rhodococcus sp. 27YEA15]
MMSAHVTERFMTGGAVTVFDDSQAITVDGIATPQIGKGVDFGR